MTQVLEKICIVCRREFPKDVHECPDDLVRLTDKDPLLGTIFDGKFEIIDFIGVGGLSRVYKGRHVELNRIYAIKILKSSEFIDLQRFRREAVSIGQLSHPNIGSVFSFSVASNGRPYMVLEYIEGKDLSDLIAKENAISAARSVEIFTQVCAAIAYAHNSGIIHRDIKPGNIIVLSHPQDQVDVKVVDFGMARILHEGKEAQKLTKTGEIFGTRQYISPEQYSGAAADERADVYSLGVSLKESLGNERAPDALRKIIDKATQRDPLKRYSNAEEMRQDLLVLQENPSRKMISAAGGNSSGFQLCSLVIGIILLSAAGLSYFASVVQNKTSASQSQKRSISKSIPLRFAATQGIANDLIIKGRLREAEEVLKRWYDKNKSTASPKDLFTTVLDLGGCLASQDKEREAIYYYDDAIRIIRKRQEKERKGRSTDDVSTASLYIARMRTENQFGKYESAVLSGETGIAFLKSIDSESALSSLVLAYSYLAQAYEGLNNLREAESYARKACAIAVKTFGESSRVSAVAFESLGSVLLKKEELEEASKLIDQAVEIRKEATPPRDALLYINALIMQVKCEQALRHQKRARKKFNELTIILAKANPGTHRRLLKTQLVELDKIADEFEIPENNRFWKAVSLQTPPS